MTRAKDLPSETARLQALVGELLETSREQPLVPPPDFDEVAYLAEYPDVAEAVRAGRITSGFEHYWNNGRHEGRRRFSKLS